MSQFQQLDQLMERQDGMLRTGQVLAAGISKPVFYQFVQSRGLEQAAHGIYLSKDAWVDAMYLLHLRCPQAVFSHETALFLHGISDRTPFEHTVTAPSGCIPSAAIKAECKVYYIKPELFELGKTMLQTPAGNPVPCYDLERTICDVVRSRNKIGTETFLSALKQYAASPQKDLNRLDEYARRMRVSGVLRQYLEVLL